MYKQKRKTLAAVLEQLLPILLSVICIFMLADNSYQAIMAVPCALNFEGEYSFDDGESWQVLTAESDLSVNRGDLLLRGHFDEELFPGALLYLYRDHIGVSIKVNGEMSFMSIQSEILKVDDDIARKYLTDNCGRDWTLINFYDGLKPTDTVEIHLQKMHNYVDRHAYRNLLNSCVTGPIDTKIVETYLQPYVSQWLLFAGCLLFVAVMMLGATVASVFFRTSVSRDLSKLGFLLLFAGGYVLLDIITVSFWSDLQVFNTYTRQICMMLAVYWVGLILRDLMTGPRHKIAKVVLGISFVLNIALILPALTGTWIIYETLPVWAAGQIFFTVILLGTVAGELRKCGRNKWLNLCSCALLLVTVLLDMAGIGSSMYSHGTCTKVVFAVLFIIHGFRGLKRSLVDYQGARQAQKLEKELEESRISIMLSQMQPHFIYNILNVIYYLCGKEPTAAQAAISRFSDYLRNNLEALSQKELISFRKELDHIHTYLELEQIRFGEELSVIYDIEEDSFLLPVLSIQPLVENAVKHGIAKKRGGGVVTISSRQTENAYQIIVADTGVGFDADRYMEDGKVHVGLINVRQRLANSTHAKVDIDSAPDNGTTVTVTIPKEMASE